VLVVSSHTIADLAVSISLEGLSARFPEAARNLFIVHIDPRDAIAEQVRIHFPIRIAADAVLNSTIFLNLVEIAPGLKEFFFLSRMQSLAERRSETSEYPLYDLLVWDAPASGHFLATLKTGREFETFLTGPLASGGAEARRFFSGTDRLLVYPVTTLEEMAITETIELAADLKTTFGLSCACVLLNLVSPLCVATEEDIASLPAAPRDTALRFAIDRGLLERERALDLEERLHAPRAVVPRITHRPTDLDLLVGIAERLEIPEAR
jgi:anion-transporting  ArsA/GET3 family ATPase